MGEAGLSGFCSFGRSKPCNGGGDVVGGAQRDGPIRELPRFNRPDGNANRLGHRWLAAKFGHGCAQDFELHGLRLVDALHCRGRFVPGHPYVVRALANHDDCVHARNRDKSGGQGVVSVKVRRWVDDFHLVKFSMSWILSPIHSIQGTAMELP